MPKSIPARRPRKQTSTEERRARSAQIRERGLEMSFRCGRCEEKNLRCFVDTATGRCAGCIAVKAECSLFVSEEDWEKVQAEKREKRLEVARLKAQLAQRELELLEAEAREREYANRDHAVLSLQDKAKEWAEGSAAPGTGPSAIEPPLSEPSADLGWLQADSFDFLSFADPLLDPDLSSFLDSSLGLGFAVLDAVGGTSPPIPCSP
jgi:hypothetical protein